MDDENAPPPRRGHCSFVRGGRHVVIYGGVHQAWGYEGCSPESASTCKYLHDMRQYDTQKQKWWAVAQTSEEEMGLPQGRTGHVCAHKDAWHNAEVLVVWGGEGYGYEQVSGAYVDDGPWLFTFSTAAASEKQPSGAWRRLVPAGGVPQPKPWGAVGAMEQDALVLYGGLPTHDPLRIPKGGSLQQQATSAVWRLQWQPLGTLTSAEPTTGRCEGGAIVTSPRAPAPTDGTLGDVAAASVARRRARACQSPSRAAAAAKVAARTREVGGIAPQPVHASKSRAFGIMEANPAFTAADIRVSPRTLVLPVVAVGRAQARRRRRRRRPRSRAYLALHQAVRVGVAARSVEMSGGTPLVDDARRGARARRWHASSHRRVAAGVPCGPDGAVEDGGAELVDAQFFITPCKSPFTGGRDSEAATAGVPQGRRQADQRAEEGPLDPPVGEARAQAHDRGDGAAGGEDAVDRRRGVRQLGSDPRLRRHCDAAASRAAADNVILSFASMTYEVWRGDKTFPEARQRLSVNLPFPPGEWVHVAVLHDMTENTAFIFWNQIPVASGQVHLPRAGVERPSCLIGRSNFVGDPIFRGMMKDLFVYETCIDRQGMKTVVDQKHVVHEESLVHMGMRTWCGENEAFGRSQCVGSISPEEVGGNGVAANVAVLGQWGYDGSGCPASFPHQSGNSKICYNDKSYATAGSGPCSSWCTTDVDVGSGCGDDYNKENLCASTQGGADFRTADLQKCKAKCAATRARASPSRTASRRATTPTAPTACPSSVSLRGATSAASGEKTFGCQADGKGQCLASYPTGLTSGVDPIDPNDCSKCAIGAGITPGDCNAVCRRGAFGPRDNRASTVCPPAFPHRSSGASQICYNDASFATAASGPCGSWCTTDVNVGSGCGDNNAHLCGYAGGGYCAHDKSEDPAQCCTCGSSVPPSFGPWMNHVINCRSGGSCVLSYTTETDYGSCQTKCAKVAGCRAWTYRIKGGLCWVLNGYALKEPRLYDGYISGAPYTTVAVASGGGWEPFHGFTPKPINFGPYENHKIECGADNAILSAGCNHFAFKAEGAQACQAACAADTCEQTYHEIEGLLCHYNHHHYDVRSSGEAVQLPRVVHNSKAAQCFRTTRSGAAATPGTEGADDLDPNPRTTTITTASRTKGGTRST